MEEINIKINEIENRVRLIKHNLNFELNLLQNNIDEITESIIEIKSILEMLINKYKHLNIMLNHRYD